jgi:hypothetical protein
MKLCEKCGIEYFKHPKSTDHTFMNRRFCSKKCSSMKYDSIYDKVCIEYISGLSSKEVGIINSISSTHVIRILKKNKIEIRSLSESVSIGLSRETAKIKMSKNRTGKKLSEYSKDKLRSRIGPKNHNWKGGVTITSQGYLSYTASSFNGDKASRLHHRYIVENNLGLRLPTDIHVHHIDGDKKNNDLSNLSPMTSSEHAALHVRQGDIFKRITKC